MVNIDIIYIIISVKYWLDILLGSYSIFFQQQHFKMLVLSLKDNLFLIFC